MVSKLDSQDIGCEFDSHWSCNVSKLHLVFEGDASCSVVVSKLDSPAFSNEFDSL